MELITIFMLLGPGILLWWLDGDCDLSNGAAMIRMLLKLIFNNFVILMLSYMVLTMMYGYMAVNLSGEYVEGVGNSIFNISFVWKYGMLSCGIAVALHVVKRIWTKITSKRKHK